MSYSFEQVMFESDCQMVVNAMKIGYLCGNELGTLFFKSPLSPNADHNQAFVVN